MTTTNRNDFSDLFDDMVEWLDLEPSHHAWAIIEEAARLQSISAQEPNNLHLAGRVYGMAAAVSVMYDREQGYGIDEANAQAWVQYVGDFAESNYEDGERIG